MSFQTHRMSDNLQEGQGRMRSLLRVVDRTCILFSLLAVTCWGQVITATRGKNPMDGRSWVTINILAQQAYKTPEGGDFTPTLQVRCELTKNKPTLDILLATGGAQLVKGFSVLGVEQSNYQRWWRMKVGSAKPTVRSWYGPAADNSTFSYEGYLVNNVLGRYRPASFLKDMFSGQTVMIEFRPLGLNDAFVADFSVAGLRQEFDQHSECALPK